MATVQVDIAGLTAFGFGPGADLLLVLSHSGLGVVDCATGRTVARDPEDRDLPDGGFPIWAPGIVPSPGSACRSRASGAGDCGRCL